MTPAHSAVATVLIRPIEPRDRHGVDALLRAILRGSSSLERGREVVSLALGASNREYRALVALADGDIAGVVAFGELLGSDGVIRLHLLASRASQYREVDGQLLAMVEDTAKGVRARFIFAEIPDDQASRKMLDALDAAGYAEEARIADYVRDGVPLILLRRPL